MLTFKGVVRGINKAEAGPAPPPAQADQPARPDLSIVSVEIVGEGVSSSGPPAGTPGVRLNFTMPTDQANAYRVDQAATFTADI